MKNIKIINLFLLVCVVITTLIYFLIIYERKSSLKAEKIYIKYEAIDNLKKEFNNKIFPLDLNLNNFHFIKDWDVKRINGYIIIIVSESTCNKCLLEQLEIVRVYEEKIKKNNFILLTFLGVSVEKEERDI